MDQILMKGRTIVINVNVIGKVFSFWPKLSLKCVSFSKVGNSFYNYTFIISFISLKANKCVHYGSDMETVLSLCPCNKWSKYSDCGSLRETSEYADILTDNSSYLDIQKHLAMY